MNDGRHKIAVDFPDPDGLPPEDLAAVEKELRGLAEAFGHMAAYCAAKRHEAECERNGKVEMQAVFRLTAHTLRTETLPAWARW